MAEVLTHVLVAYVVFTIASWWSNRIEPQWVVVAMVGAILPDLDQLDLVLDADTITTALGIPFGWGALHTIGGVMLLSGIGALLFTTRRQQVMAFLMLLGGGITHLALDAVKAWGDGYNGVYLYPFSWWRNPTPGWYVSADRWVLVLTAILAFVVFVLDRHMRTEEPDPTKIDP